MSHSVSSSSSSLSSLLSMSSAGSSSQVSDFHTFFSLYKSVHLSPLARQVQSGNLQARTHLQNRSSCRPTASGAGNPEIQWFSSCSSDNPPMIGCGTLGYTEGCTSKMQPGSLRVEYASEFCLHREEVDQNQLHPF